MLGRYTYGKLIQDLMITTMLAIERQIKNIIIDYVSCCICCLQIDNSELSNSGATHEKNDQPLLALEGARNVPCSPKLKSTK